VSLYDGHCQKVEKFKLYANEIARGPILGHGGEG